jgi:hypothetical protein
VASQANQFAASPARRIRALVTPREHGAWGLLLVPLVTGGAVGLLEGGNFLPLLTLTIATIALFWLRTPVESWFGAGVQHAQAPEERRAVALAMFPLIGVSVFALGLLFWNRRNPELLLLGAVALLAFIAQAILRKLSCGPRILSQVVGTLGLTITAPVAYYVVTGELNREAWALWMANSMFAVNQVHFVQLRIHSMRLNGWTQKFERGRGFLLGEVGLVAALILAWRYRLLPWLAAAAFLPLLFRGAAWFLEKQKALVVRRLGWTELGYAIFFGICLVAGFHLGR